MNDRPPSGPRRLDPQRAARERRAGLPTEPQTGDEGIPAAPDPAQDQGAHRAGRWGGPETRAPGEEGQDGGSPGQARHETVPGGLLRDPRRAGWAVGAFGLLLVIVVSIHQLSAGHPGTAGIPPGQSLKHFVAPLATGSLSGDANLTPRCDPARPDREALNVCGRGRLALALFVPTSSKCVRAVDTLQAVARRYPRAGIQFAAVGVAATRATVARLARTHGWTIPVAYDRDGAVGQLYGVVICPMFELAGPGGKVLNRLIGDRWLSVGVLAAQVAALRAGSSGPAGAGAASAGAGSEQG